MPTTPYIAKSTFCIQNNAPGLNFHLRLTGKNAANTSIIKLDADSTTNLKCNTTYGTDGYYVNVIVDCAEQIVSQKEYDKAPDVLKINNVFSFNNDIANLNANWQEARLLVRIKGAGGAPNRQETFKAKKNGGNTLDTIVEEHP